MSGTSHAGRILCIGEAMAELMLGSSENFPPALGFAGDTMNTAIYLKRLLGINADLSYVTVVGNDTLSARLVRLLETESIDTSKIKHSADRLIGLYAITTDDSGERTFSYWRSESAARTLFQEGSGADFRQLSDANVIYLSAITLAILPPTMRTALLKELDRLRSVKQVKVVFDSNYRPALWESKEVAQHIVSEAWKITDIALPSVDDELMLFDDADEISVVKRLEGYGIDQGALKRGAKGPLSLNSKLARAHKEIESIDNSSVQVVDTTAAGDSFNAGFMSAILSGADDQVALKAGHACSVRVIGHNGAIIPLDKWG